MAERVQMLEVSRVIIFTSQMNAMEAFYRDVVGLPVVGREPGWVELSAGACAIALHKRSGGAAKGATKIVFYAADVDAARQSLIAKGAASGKVVRSGEIHFWDTADPDGNIVQVSNRKQSSV